MTALAADAALIDLDGTLVDSSQALVRCWTRWAREFEVAEADLARVAKDGLTSQAIVRALVPPHRVEEAQRRIEELETADVEGIVALPGALDLLAALPTGRWAVVTSGTTAVATARMKAAGISTDVLVSADDVRQGKPHPEPYLLGAKLLGIDPARCVVIEDAPAGLASAAAAGMRSVAVRRAQAPGSYAGKHTRQEELRADLVVEGLHKLGVRLDDDRRTIHLFDKG